MPTQQTTYNSRITDEALEKKFRDSFRSQGGAELVDDLYASGVIVPVIDFSDAAAGSVLGQNLQTAWDFSTGSILLQTTTLTDVITSSGFWQVDLTHTGYVSTGAAPATARLQIWDGTTGKTIWGRTNINGAGILSAVSEERMVVFLRAGDSLRARCQFSAGDQLDIWYRQIADVSGNLVNPTGFTSS